MKGEPGLDSRNSGLGYKHPKWHLNCYKFFEKGGKNSYNNSGECQYVRDEEVMQESERMAGDNRKKSGENRILFTKIMEGNGR